MTGTAAIKRSTRTAAAPAVFFIKIPEPMTIWDMAPAPAPTPGIIWASRMADAFFKASAWGSTNPWITWKPTMIPNMVFKVHKIPCRKSSVVLEIMSSL